MSNYVDFGMVWQCYGRQSIKLPDDIDPNNTEAIIAFIKENWDNIPVPEGEYIACSDELDEGCDFNIYSDNEKSIENPAKNEIVFSSDGMSIENNLVKVEWDNADEGWNGDYDPEDPDDENLLRFDVYRRSPDGGWEAVDDASYCTRMPANTCKEVLQMALRMLLKEYTNALASDPYCSVKKLGESLSWISPEMFEPPISRSMIRQGIQQGVIKFIPDPNFPDSGKGTVCKIGANWFYHGGHTAEEETPEEYIKNTPLEIQVNDIYETLIAFRDSGHEELTDEYKYYKAYLLERLKS